MPRRTQVWKAWSCCLLALAVSACSISPTSIELGAECGNDSDDDGDGMQDCADPDCQAESMCGGEAPPTPAPSEAMADPNQMSDDVFDASSTPPNTEEQPQDDMLDAGASEPDTAPPTMQDAAVESPDTGVTPIDPCGSCTADEVCDGNACVPVTPAGPTRWEITGIHTVVPRAMSTAYSCIEGAAVCPNLALPDFPTCTCAVDPEVTVYVSRDGGPLETVFSPSYALNVDSADWVVDNVELELNSTDQVVLKVVDVNPFDTTTLFACMIEATSDSFASGSIGCEMMFPSALLDSSFVASITVDVVPGAGE